MTRLQKKCLIAVAGTHLLAVVLLLCSGFIAPTPKVDNTQVLEVIPDTLIEAELSSGSKAAPPLPPAQPVAKPVVTPPQPTPAPPKQPVTPPTFIEQVKEIFTPEPIKPDAEDPAPKKKPTKPKEHPIKVDLTLRTHLVPLKKAEDTSAAEAEAEKLEQKKIRDQQRKAFLAAARSIENNTSSATKVEMKGSSSVSYASYASAVKSIYERNWRTPNDATDEDANTRVSVTIARDGTVISSRILTPSGDASVDRSVQQTLERVTFIAPFPDGSTESEKTFIITFNLKSKRMLG
jgi:TonB family protein